MTANSNGDAYLVDEEEEAFHPALTRRLMQQQHNTTSQRVSNEAIVAASEVLRLFVQEACHRASIEAEIEKECRMNEQDDDGDDNDDGNGKKGHKSDKTPVIRADHITKIAAELLMDFS